MTKRNFCLARFSIPNRWDEDKGAQEEVEQKLMGVSAVECVFSRLGDPMNKSKFLCGSLSFPSFSGLFLSLPLSWSIALLCSMRLVERWFYLLAGSVCLRSAGKANAFPDTHGQYSVLLCSDLRSKIMPHFKAVSCSDYCFLDKQDYLHRVERFP